MLTDDQITELHERIGELEYNDVYNIMASAIIRLLDLPAPSVYSLRIHLQLLDIVKSMREQQDALRRQQQEKNGPDNESNRGEAGREGEGGI